MMDRSFTVVGSAPLTSCDHEPIHLLGSIQPTGFLLSVNAHWWVVRASVNVKGYLGVAHEEVVGQPAAAHLPPDVLHDIRGCLQSASGAGIVGRLFGQRLVEDGPTFDIAVHQSDREFVLEFEPSTGELGGSLSILRAMVAGVERQSSPEALFREAARHVRTFIEFDRVMVYRFDDDGAGEVVAEAAKAGLKPFMGLRFPASDIPVQARALYERNYLRTIVDVDAIPVAVLPILSSEGSALDLSMSMLRSVSPIHIEYLKNMGVQSSMSISILRNGRLWGLIACHHGVPRHISFEMRSTAEMFGQMFSYLLEEHQREDDDASDAAAQGIHDKIASAFVDPGTVLDNISEFLATIVDYIPSDGVGIFLSGKIALSGLTPTRDEFLHLINFLKQSAPGTTLATYKIGTIFPAAKAFVDRAAGVLAIPISRTTRNYIVFFRREVLKAVQWAGQPVKVEAGGPDSPRLTPRKSFEAWREIVQGQAAPWAKRDLRAADALRSTLVEMALQTSDNAHADRTDAGQRQEILIAELNHRNRNILGLVRGLVTQSAASALDVAALVENLDDRIRSLASAHDILTSRNWRPSSLHALLRAEISTYSLSDASLELVGPDVMLQPQAYTAMAMVVHELVTNARKHGALSGPLGKVSVDTRMHANKDVAISWSESGGPIVRPPLRRGFGSTILEQAIPFEVSGISTPRYLPDGFRLDTILPAAVAVCVAAATPTMIVPGRMDEGNHLDALALGVILQTALVVEDNLFIAVDAEDMLRRLGAGSIEVVKTVSEALNVLEERSFTFALLDVNLGVETSLPIALALQAKKVPFIFGTGYGEALSMPETLARIPIVSKPYSRQTMRAALIGISTQERNRSSGRRTNAPEASAIKAGELSRKAIPHKARVTIYQRKPVDVQPQAATGDLASENLLRSTEDDAAPFVRKLEALAPLSKDDKMELVGLCSAVRLVEAQTDIVGLNEDRDRLYILLEGFACRYKLRSDGARQIVSYLVPGDFCDFTPMAGKMPDSVGAISKCRIAHASRAHVLDVRRTNPRVSDALQQSLFIDLATLGEWLMNIGRRSPEERFAHLFCEIQFRLRAVGLSEGNSFTFPVTQFDLGDTMGLSYVHVNRTLQTLRQRGLISLKGKLMTLLDEPALRTLAGFSPDYLRPEGRDNQAPQNRTEVT